MQTYKTKAQLQAALEALSLQDARLAHAFEKYGTPALRPAKQGFGGLVGLLIGQQVSTKAGDAIQARFDAQFPDTDPATVLAASDATLAACGLSRPKQRYIRNLAQAILDGTLNIAALRRASDEDVFARLTALVGIGPWTADCYLLFALRRCDRFPAGDLALQEGYRLLYQLNTRPDAAQLAQWATRWQPHRAAAARLLWRYYNGERENLSA